MLVEKTIKFHSEKLNTEQVDTISQILYLRQQCRNYFYSRFSGIQYMDKLNFWDIRNYLLNNEKDELKKFKLSARVWKMKLSEVIANIKTMWSQVETVVKKYIRDNEQLSEEDRDYLYYILKAKSLWLEVINTGSVTETNKLSQIKVSKDKKYLCHLLARYTRYAKPKISHSVYFKSMQLDSQMYSLKDGILQIVTLEKRKRLSIDLKNKNVSLSKGNIRIVFHKEQQTLEVHRCIFVEAKDSSNQQTKEIGLDKGYTTMLSSSEENEYGFVLGDLLARASYYINDKNKKRNQYHAMVRNLTKELKENKSLTKEEQKQIRKKIRNIETFNLSNKSYLRKRNKDKEIIKSYVNHEIKRMIINEHPTVIALEDLTFESDKKHCGKNFNRKMTSWIKGYIDERLNYHAKLNGIKIIYVSAAYTSQFCATCGSPLTTRTGEHHEIGICPNCGKINANINGGKNIKLRIQDNEITLFTPHQTIKRILTNRYEQKKKINKLLK